MKCVEVYGDSILKGIQLDSGTGKYRVDNRIGVEEIEQKFNLKVINSSRFGCTVTKAKLIVMKALQRGKTADCVLVEYGGNDCDFNWQDISREPAAEYEPKTPFPLFVDSYKRLVTALQQSGAVVYISNLPPVIAEKYLDWICRNGLSKQNILSWLGSAETIYRYQERYSKAAEYIAKECGATLVDIRGAFLDHRRIDGLYCDDGIHPNGDGQKLIGEALMGFIAARTT